MTEQRILIVESRRNIRDVLIDLVELERKVGIGVETGEAALIKARESKPDLMLVSLELHGEMDGLSTIIAMRRVSSMPVVLLIDNAVGDSSLQKVDGNMLILRMADLDHLSSAMKCLLPTSARPDDQIRTAMV